MQPPDNIHPKALVSSEEFTKDFIDEIEEDVYIAPPTKYIQ